jgi:hypothetical protein
MAVIFGQDALSDSTLEKLSSYLRSREKEFVWGSNYLLWPPTLTTRGGGVVLTHKLTPEWTESLLEELHSREKLSYMPSSGTAMYYAWFGGSSINWHTDYADKSSMTIYLSKEWLAEYGGYFCWKDWDSSDLNSNGDVPREARIRVPMYNTFVHITKAEWHATTYSAPFAPVRSTLQLFFSHK